MKTLNRILLFVLIWSLISALPLCKKEKLSPGQAPFAKGFEVFKSLNTKNNNIKNNIKNGRTITNGEFNWNGEIIVIGGPIGYHPLYHKGAVEFCKAFQEEIMPDTTQLSINCMQEDIINKFLYEKWDHDAEKAFRRLRLEISKTSYEVYPRLFERWLTAEYVYLTTQIGGNPDWYPGTRNLEMEKEIALLPYTDDTDFQDPQQCNCSPVLYIEDYYKKYSEGNNKSLIVENPDYILELQQKSAVERQSKMGKSGDPIQYTTQYDTDKEVYYLDIRVEIEY